MESVEKRLGSAYKQVGMSVIKEYKKEKKVYKMVIRPAMSYGL